MFRLLFVPAPLLWLLFLHTGSEGFFFFQFNIRREKGLTTVFGKHNAVSVAEGAVNSGNFPKSNEERNSAANVSVNSDSIQNLLPDSGKILHNRCTRYEQAF